MAALSLWHKCGGGACGPHAIACPAGSTSLARSLLEACTATLIAVGYAKVAWVSDCKLLLLGPRHWRPISILTTLSVFLCKPFSVGPFQAPTKLTRRVGCQRAENKYDAATVANDDGDAITSAAVSFSSEPIGPDQCVPFAELVRTHLDGIRR